MGKYRKTKGHPPLLALDNSFILSTVSVTSYCLLVVYSQVISMAYREEIFQAKGIIERKKYHTYRLGGRKERMPNFQPSTEKTQEWNLKRAEKKLYRTIFCNFSRDDLYITLTYRTEPTYDEAKRNISNFMRRLKRRYRKQGKELKYIYTTEYRGKRIHHHLLIPAGITRAEINEVWGLGIISHYAFQYYDGQFEDAKRLASYFIKESLRNVREGRQKLRWVGSKNLIQPKVHYRTIQSRHWKEEPKAPAGYLLAELLNGYTDEGYRFQFVRFIQAENFRNQEPVFYG